MVGETTEEQDASAVVSEEAEEQDLVRIYQ
jgi:hypothetical protein